jgi:hypothetical protein
MPKTIIVKLTKAGNRATGPFTVKDNLGNTLDLTVSRQTLIDGKSYTVDDSAIAILIISDGKCVIEDYVPITSEYIDQIDAIRCKLYNTGSTWRHLTNTLIYNKFYNVIEPYIIEYPFSYQSYDEILQNVKDYTKAYKYLPIPDGVFNDNARIETDNQYFNKAVLYNGQQSTGILELVPKPKNNLSQYMTYPIYNAESKTITYTKSDNFYQYNTFWGLVKDKTVPLFSTTCESLSIDKVVNQSNMDYTKRSFKKEPLRAKDLKVRHILDNSSEAHLVSQFIIAPAQISYK